MEVLVMRNIALRMRNLYRRHKKAILNRVARVNPNPVFVLGNQKSGTSAIERICGGRMKTFGNKTTAR